MYLRTHKIHIYSQLDSLNCTDYYNSEIWNHSTDTIFGISPLEELLCIEVWAQNDKNTFVLVEQVSISLSEHIQGYLSPRAHTCDGYEGPPSKTVVVKIAKC